MQIRFLVLSILIFLGSISSSDAKVCEETEDRHAHHIFTEISGTKKFQEKVNEKWTFTFLRVDHGWAIRLYDTNQIDLTQITPPYKFSTNPRDILGWHFRNTDNTQPNDGSVNAPQHFREFLFSDNLEGTGGFKPSTQKPQFIEPTQNDGRGWINIVDYALADLEKNKKARLMYLKFIACLTWPKTTEEMREKRNQRSPHFLPEEEEQMRVCGLPLSYELEAFIKPRWLTGDFDGDDAADILAPVIHKETHIRGIAICRAGTWFDILNSDNLTNLENTYLDRVEAWSIASQNNLIHFKSQNLRTDGDILMLERLEKSRYLIYRKDNNWKVFLEYSNVEP